VRFSIRPGSRGSRTKTAIQHVQAKGVADPKKPIVGSFDPVLRAPRAAATAPPSKACIASYVDRILRSPNRGDLPVQFSTKFELVTNLGTASAVGLAIPRALLVAADEAIEWRIGHVFYALVLWRSGN
jgi:ABC-type uncharacterized transport system substrate-binding protein